MERRLRRANIEKLQFEDELSTIPGDAKNFPGLPQRLRTFPGLPFPGLPKPQKILWRRAMFENPPLKQGYRYLSSNINLNENYFRVLWQERILSSSEDQHERYLLLHGLNLLTMKGLVC